MACDATGAIQSPDSAAVPSDPKAFDAAASDQRQKQLLLDAKTTQPATPSSQAIVGTLPDGRTISVYLFAPPKEQTTLKDLAEGGVSVRPSKPQGQIGPTEGGGRASRLIGLGLICAAVALLAPAAPAGAHNCNTNNGLPYPSGSCLGWTHWSDGTGTTAHVTIVDHTPAGWPVYAAFTNWDFLGHLSIAYRYGDCGGLVHCVGVTSASFPNWNCHDNPGYATLVPNGNGHEDSTSSIRLNDDCLNNWSTANRKVITCQEQAHIYGAGHEYESLKDQTCMATPTNSTYNIDSWVNTPRSHDFVELDDNIYNHND